MIETFSYVRAVKWLLIKIQIHAVPRAPQALVVSCFPSWVDCRVSLEGRH